MRNFFNVLKFEYTGMVRGKGFLITVALFMILLLVVASLPIILGFFGNGGDQEIYYDAAGEQAVGVFYDTTGWYTPEIIASFSPQFDWTPIDRPDAIEQGLEAGDFAIGLRLTAEGITVYMPGSDWMGAGTFMFYEMARSTAQTQALEQAGIDAQLIETVLAADPTMDVVIVGRDGGQSYFVAMAFTILLMLMVSMFGAIVSHSVSTEKTSKAIELLTISTSSNSLIFGKVVGVGLVALTQFAIALIPGVLVMYFNLERWHEFAPAVGGIMEMIFASNILGLAFLFFLLAFFTYAFLFAALSSTVSRAEDLSSSQSIPTVLLMAAYFVAFTVPFSPNAFHAQVLSYVPFFSPLVMMTRATMTEVPMWEIALSAGASFLYVLLLGFLSAKIFRIGIMLTGNRPNLRQIFKLMRQA